VFLSTSLEDLTEIASQISYSVKNQEDGQSPKEEDCFTSSGTIVRSLESTTVRFTALCYSSIGYLT
jgi:hypothetical protein